MGTYKDSGIEWIGEIPEGWEVSKVKYKYEFTTGFTPDTSNTEFYDDENGAIWVTIADLDENKYIFDSKSKLSSIYIETYTPKPVKKGSLLYSFKLSVGKTAFAGTDLYTNEAIGAFINHENVNLNYLNYASFLMEFNANRNIYNAKLLNSTLIKNSIMVVPPLQEQAAIADFLDKKSAEIDAIIAKITHQIQTLKDYRQSLITETVTKGLDKTVSYKDSGIEWIGKIPEGWGIIKIKHAFKLFAGGDIDYNDYSEEQDGFYQYPILANSLENSGIIGFTSKYRFSGETITITGRGSVGVAFHRNFPYFPVVRLLVGVPTRNLSTKYVTYSINSFDTIGEQTAMTQLTTDKLGVEKIPLPPLREQTAIADFLDDKTAKIDCIIAKKEQQLDIIKEHRKSLIYEYVTGKKRVKEYQKDGN